MNSMRVAVLFALLSIAQAQRAGATAESALVDLENRWVAALVKADIAALNLRFFADGYVDGDEDAHRSDKAGVMGVLKSGDLKIKSITLSDMKVHLYGAFAVVTGTGVQAGTFQGKPLKSKVLFTDSFVLQNGKWRAVASQRTPAQ